MENWKAEASICHTSLQWHVHQGLYSWCVLLNVKINYLRENKWVIKIDCS